MRILAFAYACEPKRGSEPGAGWSWARMLARIGDTWVVTRANNREAIEAHLPSVPERKHLHFVYVDLPAWARFWKRGQRGIHAYYAIWQLAAIRRALALHRSVRFDLAWHLTFANVWIGSLACLLGPTFVYGPVGGGATAPWLLLPALGVRGAAYEVARALARTAGRFLNPVARLSWRRARLILVQNEETRQWLPARHRGRTRVFPNTIIEDVPPPPGRRPVSREPTAAFAGKLLPLKGVSLAIDAVALLPRWRLLVFGSGPDEPRLRRRVERLGLQDRVHFMDHVPRDRLLRLLRDQADVFLFPSLHDQASWSVVEALALGLPVVSLRGGGHRGEGILTVPASIPSRTACAMAKQTLRAFEMVRVSAPRMDIEARHAALTNLLGEEGLLDRVDDRPRSSY